MLQRLPSISRPSRCPAHEWSPSRRRSWRIAVPTNRPWRRWADAWTREGIRCWLDKWNLIPGEEWQPAVEAALGDCRCCRQCFSARNALGPWQNEEMRAAIARRVQAAAGDLPRPAGCAARATPRRSWPTCCPRLACKAPRGSNSPTRWTTRTPSTGWSAGSAVLRRASAGGRSALSNDDPYRGLSSPCWSSTAQSFLWPPESPGPGAVGQAAGRAGEARRRAVLAIVGASGSGKSSLARSRL